MRGPTAGPAVSPTAVSPTAGAARVEPAPDAGPGRAPHPAGVGGTVPPRVRRALGSQRAWGRAGVHLVPVRHHSPACALALSALLEEVRPGVVLIEGPAEYTSLLPALQDPATVPPVAVLSLTDHAASYYPLAEFSPEWVALRWAGRHGARAAFIDRGPTAPDAGRAVRTLQAEYHLARSTTLDALARRLGCRDHDEVWEQLFEDRDTADIRAWRGFFADTLAWSALARLDAGREVLDADSTHAREAVMAAAVRRHLPQADGGGGKGPVVVVTGAFHTLALLDVLDNTPEAAWLPEPETGTGTQGWLIRYDFARLDSLRGYGAGMPSPGLWQRAWRARTTAPGADAAPGGRRGTKGSRPGPNGALTGPRGFATTVVLDVASALRDQGEPLGTAQVLGTVEQALGLAALRGRAWPGRTDLLDALTSCLVKDDSGLSGSLGAAVATVFAASGLGQVPQGTPSPPLVAEVRERLSALRLNLDDPVEHRVSLDTARRPRHRERRELLARLRFADVGLARQVGGADLVAGTGLGQFIEEWAYAWTPLVEAALVRAAATAPTLEILVLTRLEGHLEGEVGAGDLARLLTETAVMGLGEPVVVRVCDALETALAEISDLAELTDVLHRLAGLVEGLGRLSLEGAVPRLRLMLGRGTAAAARLVGELVGLEDDEAAGAVDALIAVRDLLARLTRVAGTRDSAGGGASNNVVGHGGVSNSDASGGSHSNDGGHVSNDSAGDVSRGNASGSTAGGGNGVAGGSDVPNGVGAVDVAAWGRDVVLREVDALRRDRATAPVLVGCATGIASTTGALGPQEVTDAVTAHLSPGADPAALADFLVGLVRTCPEVVLRAPDTLVALTRTLTGLEEPGFLALLPDLRRAFTVLRPLETHRLAEQVAALTATDASRIDVVWDVDPAQAELGWQIERDLVASLVRDGLGQWVGT